MKKQNKPKRDEIIIDISSLDPKSIKENRFIQKDAFEEVVEILKGDLTSKISKKANIHDVRAHNTIFLDGKRGSGKTQFLLGIEEYLQKKTDVKGLYFFNPIDPTLLHDNESFLTIIIAKILNNIERCTKIDAIEGKQKDFYKTLNDLSGAIDGIIHNGFEKKSALENIAQDQTSLQLEEYIHQFFKLVTKMLHKKRLVLLIDDVDMAFEKGFEVLEVVRKYLSSPYVIPIVTGDLELYQVIVENNFIKKLDNGLKEDNKDRNHKVAIDYLIKVLPTHRRVRVKTLYELSQDRDIRFLHKNNNEFLLTCSSCDRSDKNTKYFRKYVDEIFNSNIEEISNKFIRNLFLNNLRNVIQFLHKNLIKIDELYQQNQLKDIDNKKIEKVEDNYQLRLLDNIFTCETYYTEALKQFQKTNFDKVVELTNKCLELPPTNKKMEYKTLILKGKALHLLNKTIDAIDIYEIAIDLIDGSDYEAYFLLANVYADIGDFLEAEDYYEQALSIDDSRAEVYKQLAILYYNFNHYEEALKTYNKAKKLDEKDCNLSFQIGLCYAKLGKNKDAIKSYETSYNCKQHYITQLCLLELYMIEEENEHYESMSEDLKDKYSDNKNVMKIYKMIELLYFISKNIYTNEMDIYDLFNKIEDDFNKWYQEFSNVIPAIEWHFTEIDLWLEHMEYTEKKPLLSEYIDNFKDTLNNVKK